MGSALQKGSWNPDVRRKLREMIDEYGRWDLTGGEPPLAVFDLDQTCIRGDIGYAFFHTMVETASVRYWFEPFRKFFMEFDPRGHAREVLQILGASQSGKMDRSRLAFLFHDIYRTIREDMGEAEAFGWMAGLLLGWRHQEVRDETERILQKELAAPLGERTLAEWAGNTWVVPTGIRIYGEMKGLIGALQKTGFDVWIISATSQCIVEAAARHLGVPAGRCIGVRHRTENGFLTSLGDTVTYREGKVSAIDRIIGRRPVFAAGDWETDLEMLGCSEGMSLLLDRGRKDLIDYGKERGWLIQPAFEV